MLSHRQMASNWAVYLICLLRCKCSWNHHRSSQKVIGKGEPRKAGDLFWCGTGHRFHEAIENQDHQYFGGCTLFNLEYRNTLEMHDFTTVNSLYRICFISIWLLLENGAPIFHMISPCFFVHGFPILPRAHFTPNSDHQFPY